MDPSILIFPVLGVVMYMLLIRPQQKKIKAEQALMASLRPGDEIMTVGGIYGVILEAPEGEDFVWLDVAEGVELKLSRTAAKSIISRDGDDAADAAVETDDMVEASVDETVDETVDEMADDTEA